MATRLRVGVCFPAVTVNRDLDPGLPKEFVIDNTQLADIKTHLERVFEANGMVEGVIPPSKIKAFLMHSLHLSNSLHHSHRVSMRIRRHLCK